MGSNTESQVWLVKTYAVAALNPMSKHGRLTHSLEGNTLETGQKVGKCFEGFLI